MSGFIEKVVGDIGDKKRWRKQKRPRRRPLLPTRSRRWSGT